MQPLRQEQKGTVDGGKCFVKVCEQEELRPPQNYNMEQQQQNPGFNSLATAQQFHELPLTVSSMQNIIDELLPEPNRARGFRDGYHY